MAKITIDFATTNGSWRFMADNRECELPIDGANINHILAGITDPRSIEITCEAANFMDEVRAGALGG